jgi:ankyrin repeat protein
MQDEKLALPREMSGRIADRFCFGRSWQFVCRTYELCSQSGERAVNQRRHFKQPESRIPPRPFLISLMFTAAGLLCIIGTSVTVAQDPAQRVQNYQRQVTGNSLCEAATRGQIERVRRLLETDPGLVHAKNPFRKQTPLHLAAANGRLKVAELLLAKGARVDTLDSQQMQPLHSAAYGGHPELIELLLQQGANIEAVDISGSTPLFHAASGGNVKAVQTLLDKGAKVTVINGHGETPLHWAASRDHGAVVELLLDKGVSREAASKLGRTALHDAAWDGQAKAVTALLARNAAVNARDKDGSTPLHLAARDRNGYAAVAVLLAKGGDPNARRLDGTTPLIVASNNDLKVVELLLLKGANVNLAKFDGWTALHEAAKRDNEPMVRFLMSHGANPKATHNGSAPWYFAPVKGKVRVFLMQAAGVPTTEGVSRDGPPRRGRSKSGGRG